MKIIDCDSHFIVPEIYNYVSDHLKPLLPQLVFGHDGQLTEINYKIDPITNADAKFPNTLHCDLPGMSNILKRIEDLATMQVNKQLLTPQERAMRFNYSVEKNLAAEIAHSYNLITKQIVDTYPDKFFASALLPLQDIDLALAELDWVIKNNFKIGRAHV